MIKDKITRQLKIKFKEMIEKTRKDGKEHGFIIRLKDGKLFPEKEFEGTEYGLKFSEIKFPFFVQGNFHTHPLLFSGRKALKKLGYDVENEIDIRSIMEHGIHSDLDSKLYSIESPSYNDLLIAALSKHIRRTGGTVCTSTDFKNNIVECWTVKDIKPNVFIKLVNEFEIEQVKFKQNKEESTPKKWVLSLFDREIIVLNE